MNRINTLIDYHKILASIEKQQSEKKKFRPKHPYMQIVMFKKLLILGGMF